VISLTLTLLLPTWASEPAAGQAPSAWDASQADQVTLSIEGNTRRFGLPWGGSEAQRFPGPDDVYMFAEGCGEPQVIDHADPVLHIPQRARPCDLHVSMRTAAFTEVEYSVRSPGVRITADTRHATLTWSLEPDHPVLRKTPDGFSRGPAPSAFFRAAEQAQSPGPTRPLRVHIQGNVRRQGDDPSTFSRPLGPGDERVWVILSGCGVLRFLDQPDPVLSIRDDFRPCTLRLRLELHSGDRQASVTSPPVHVDREADQVTLDWTLGPHSTVWTVVGDRPTRTPPPEAFLVEKHGR